MREKSRVLLLILIMVVSALVVAAVSITLLYKAAFAEQKARLVETAQSQARLIEAMARFSARYNQDYPQGALAATLTQLADAHQHYRGFGESGEFTLGIRQGENIVFLLSHRHFDLDQPKPVPFDSKLAEPMRRALTGLSGTVVGLDYRGETVLAAHEPIAGVNLGIVAKIDLSEIRAPFVRAILVAMAVGGLVIFIGLVLFVRVTNPLIRDLWRQTRALTVANQKLNQEVGYRKEIETELKRSRGELEIRVENRTLELSEANKELKREIDTRKQAVEKLEKSESRLAKAQRIAGIGNWEWNTKTGTLFWSNEIYRMFGLPIGKFEPTYQMFLDFIHPDDRGAVEGAVAEALARHGTYSIEHRILLRDGSERIVQEHAEIILGPDNTPMRMIGTVQDITERKRLELSLMESERRYRTLFEQAPAGIGIAELSGKIMDANRLMLKLFGHSIESMRRVNAKDLYATPQDRQKVVERLQQEGAVRDVEVRLRQKSGRIYEALMNIDVVTLDGRQLLFTSIRDISELKKANEMIAEMAQFVKYNPAPVLRVDKEGRILFANPAAFTYFKSGALIGKSWSVLCGVGDEDAFNNLFAGATDTLQEECVINDQTLIFTYRGVAGRDYAHIYGADVTGRRVLEEQLRQSQKMEAIGQLAGGIAHDFNTLLGIIMGYGQMLAKKIPAKDPLAEDVVEILDAANRSKLLIKQLMNFSRPSDQGIRQINLNQVVADTIKLLQSSLPTTIKVVAGMDTQDHMIMADPTQLQQVVMNLCINAGDAIGEQDGRIHITISTLRLDAEARRLQNTTHETFVALSISDTGQGMSRKVLEHIFEPFFTTKDVGKGTGLGLSVVHGIVKSHGGFIHVESRPGAGSTFQVCFPLIEITK